MGTRSQTKILHEDGTVLLNMYRQYDGYPWGHGIELFRFLENLKIVNGLGVDTTNVANGMGCLAAQMILYFKDGPGNIYIESIDADNDWIDFEYKVRYDSDSKELEVSVNDSLFMNLTDFRDFCNYEEEE